MPKSQRRARNDVSGKKAMTKRATSWCGAKSFFNINFRVDFVKPVIFALLEIASFGLFYKGNFKTLRNGWFLCQIVVFAKCFNRAALSLSAVASKEFQMLRWAFQRMENLFIVCPTYCLLQIVQVAT